MPEKPSLFLMLQSFHLLQRCNSQEPKLQKGKGSAFGTGEATTAVANHVEQLPSTATQGSGLPLGAGQPPTSSVSL